MSTMRPPLTTSMTGPLTMPPACLMASMLPQARSYWARFLDRISLPSLSSFWRTRASTRSPTETTREGSTSCLIDNSWAGMTPSDLKPISTSTSSLSILTTVAATSSPSAKGLVVASMAGMSAGWEMQESLPVVDESSSTPSECPTTQGGSAAHIRLRFASPGCSSPLDPLGMGGGRWGGRPQDRQAGVGGDGAVDHRPGLRYEPDPPVGHDALPTVEV